MATHLGTLMKRLCWENQLTTADLARKLGVSRQSVYEMFRKTHLHSRWFGPLREVLGHDFAQYYLSNENFEKVQRGDEAIHALQQENAELRKELGYLQEVNELLRKGK